MSRIVHGKRWFEGSVRDQCLGQMAARRQSEVEEMARQRAAELEEQRQLKRAKQDRRKAERNQDRALAKARRLKWERKYDGSG